MEKCLQVQRVGLKTWAEIFLCFLIKNNRFESVPNMDMMKRRPRLGLIQVKETGTRWLKSIKSNQITVHNNIQSVIWVKLRVWTVRVTTSNMRQCCIAIMAHGRGYGCNLSHTATILTGSLACSMGLPYRRERRRQGLVLGQKVTFMTLL